MPREPLLEALVSIRAHVPEDAMSAGLLGTERAGHGIRVRDDGLIITIGYVINEAEEIWIGSHDGRAVPGFVVASDFRTGLALIRPMMPLPGTKRAHREFGGRCKSATRCGSPEADAQTRRSWTRRSSPSRNLQGAGNTSLMRPYSPRRPTRAGRALR